jgi:cytidyltransferase-like protein
MNLSYKKAILGGTFDHFHLGHQKLIDAACEQSEHVTIGLAQPALYLHKFLAEAIQDYITREAALKKYLQEKGFENHAEIIPIETIYGNTLDEKDIEAIFATEENAGNVDLINTKRQEKGFPTLEVIIVEYVKAVDGAKITSERIRKGEIDRNGFVYATLFANKLTFVLPETLREELQKPFGEVINDTAGVLKLFEEKSMVIAVGDIIVSSLIESEYTPAVSVIDLRTRRHEITQTISQQGLHAPNEQGTIASEAVYLYQKALNSYLETKHPQTLIIDGEEDLLALPAILLAPLGSYVLYGQFDQGVVVNEVTPEVKQKTVEILEKSE